MEENLPTVIKINEIEVLLGKKALPAQIFVESSELSVENLIRETNISAENIKSYQNGTKEFHDMPLRLAQLLQNFINDHPPHVSYLYEGLLGELRINIDMGMIRDFIFVKRDDKPLLFTNYYPIVEFSDTQVSRSFQKEKTQNVMDEMNEWNFTSN